MAVLYSLAAITPDTEFGLSFYDYFTEEERFALWRVANLREYLPKMNSAPSRGLSIDKISRMPDMKPLPEVETCY